MIRHPQSLFGNGCPKSAATSHPNFCPVIRATSRVSTRSDNGCPKHGPTTEESDRFLGWNSSPAIKISESARVAALNGQFLSRADRLVLVSQNASSTFFQVGLWRTPR